MMFDARTVARILGGDASGNSVVAPGPGHSSKDRSLSIRIDPAAPGGFVLTSFSSTDDWQSCRDYVRERLGLEPWKPGTRDRRKPLVLIKREPDAHKENMKRIALDIWQQSVSPVGGMVEYYLREHRGLDLPAALAGDVIRFHGSLFYDDKMGNKTKLPGMVCLFRKIETNEPCGIHRTYLNRETGNRINRLALGAAGGAAIKFDIDHGNTLTIGEGVETVLSARAAGYSPSWALGSSPMVGAFPVLKRLSELTVLEENDPTSRRDVKKCSKRYLDARRPVNIVTSHVGNDFNDAWRAMK